MFSVIQKISSEQTFTDILNLYCDLDLEHRDPIFPQDTQTYDTVLSNQVWLQMEQQFRRYSRNSHFDYIGPRCDLDIEDNEPIFLHDTSTHDNTQPYQIWLLKKKWLSDTGDIEWT